MTSTYRCIAAFTVNKFYIWTWFFRAWIWAIYFRILSYHVSIVTVFRCAHASKFWNTTFICLSRAIWTSTMAITLAFPIVKPGFTIIHNVAIIDCLSIDMQCSPRWLLKQEVSKIVKSINRQLREKSIKTKVVVIKSW